MGVCRRRSLKVNAGKIKVILVGGEEELECEVCVNRIRLEDVSEFKYLECILDESGRNEAECSRKVTSWRRIAGAIRSLVNARSLQLDYTSVLHESLVVPALLIMVVIQGYGGRSRDLGLGLHRWTTSEVCWVSGE